MSIFSLFSIVLTLWRATACWNRSSLSHKHRNASLHTYTEKKSRLLPQIYPSTVHTHYSTTPSAHNRIPSTRTMSEAISFASFTSLTTQDAKIDQEQSPPPTQATSSDHPGDSESHSTTPKRLSADPPRTVRGLATWFGAKANGKIRLEVLNWDGRVVEVPKNILQKALVE
jgi:hypothetical protein